jgi:hypothetical protein
MLGRPFTEDEDKKGGDNKVVLLRYSFWMRRFGGDRNVIGQDILSRISPIGLSASWAPSFISSTARPICIFIPHPASGRYSVPPTSVSHHR